MYKEFIEDNLVLKHVRVAYKNFSGTESKFNNEGDRNFGIILDEEQALELEEIGWPIKWRVSEQEGTPPKATLRLKLSFKYPPIIYLLTEVIRNGEPMFKKTRRTEENIGDFDSIDISTVDVVVRPYNWVVKGEPGVTGYVQRLNIVVKDVGFDDDYHFVDDEDELI